MKRYRFTVTGRVQGVAFRYTTRDEATVLGLSGWVRNRPDGSVEGEFQGHDAACAKMLLWLEKGPPAARVERLATSEIPPLDQNAGFSIRPTG